jgi:hypothetical protein
MGRDDIRGCPFRRKGVEFQQLCGGFSMNPLHLRWRELVLTVVVCLTCQLVVVAADEPTLTKEQLKQFLLTAKVIDSRPAAKGITHSWRLTLSDGTLTHDAHFQPIDEHKSEMKLAMSTELNFVDSYKYNIAAYALAELIGFDDMMPVYVERKWEGQTGSLSWWMPVKMDEAERVKSNLQPPDADAWNNQMYKIRVFDQLVYDTDPNLTNFLISEDWKIWRIDFSRAFRVDTDLKDPKALIKCDRHLFGKLKALDGNQLEEQTKRYLTKREVKAVMERRDKIVAYFQKLIAEKGEDQVLY